MPLMMMIRLLVFTYELANIVLGSLKKIFDNLDGTDKRDKIIDGNRMEITIKKSWIWQLDNLAIIQSEQYNKWNENHSDYMVQMILFICRVLSATTQ